MTLNKYIKTKTEVIYGFHPVFEALNTGKRVVYRIFLISKSKKNSNRERKVLLLANSLGIECEVVESFKMRSIAQTNDHQGFAAVVSPVTLCDLKDVLDSHNFLSTNQFLVVLDGIVDPHNFGAIIRTAYCVGASGVVITKDRACFPTPAVSKISAGALEHIPICCVTNLSSTIKILQNKGFWIAGVEAVEGASSIFDLDMTGPLAIVVGNEGKGLRPLVSRQCDFLVCVPMLGNLDSLNVSVASAIVMYEIFRQRLLV